MTSKSEASDQRRPDDVIRTPLNMIQEPLFDANPKKQNVHSKEHNKIVDQVMKSPMSNLAIDQHEGGLQIQARTSAYLGPGCYETSLSDHARPNAAAFGCGEKLVRGSTKGPAMITPGPGAYAINSQTSWGSPSTRKPVTVAFQSKSQRLDYSKLRTGFSTPGPGSYSKQDFFDHQATASENAVVRTSSSNHKIRWARLPTAPSIPTVAQSFGYEQGGQGRLVRYRPVKVGYTGCGNDTLGPGEYEPMKGLKSISKTRAADFSKGKIMRFIENEVRAKAGVPGPGEYKNIKDGTALKDPARVSAVFKSALTREQVAPITTTKSVPGPGAYDFNQSSGFLPETKPEHLQFFGSTSTRFDTSRREVAPGPGAYYLAPSGNVQPQQLVPDRKLAPFSSKKERFESTKTRDQCLAAPGSYEVPSAVSEVLNKVTSRVANFGSTTKRFDTILSGVEYDTLEARLEREMKANDLDRQQQRHNSKKRQILKASSMFASSTSRTDHKNTGPSPGDYEVQRSWESSGARGAFKSGSDRMNNKPNSAMFVPGPGTYSTERSELKTQHKPRSNVFYATEPRFKEKLSKVPVLGPGHYDTNTVESDWNRPTHNISIATEMELAMLR